MPVQPPPSALALLGPTAAGKTALALELAGRIPLEIISLDSALIYRGMDIGTAKPTPAERAAVPHHLIDIIDPPQNYSVADFLTDCLRLCRQIRERGHLPLIVGGTMMYYHALTRGLNSLPAADPAIRRRLQEQKQQHGLPHLYAQLQQADPATAARLQPTDSQRIERALEVWLLTGRPLSQHLAEQQAAPPLNLHSIALIPAQRERLHRNIEQRFHTMLEQGFLQEVRQLQNQYPQLTPEYPAMRCVGYRQAWAHLGGDTDRDTFIAQGIAATRQLAKRQLTWLRKLPADLVLDPFSGSLSQHAQTIHSFYGRLP
ncbi:tRNA (adenosine(37)-N6)-dimethylallyltransferase MiaA [Eikenella sp. S3360]|uniref:tRNA dimethylallyltransferase n=1 Tax=Eikenella glucosivorans TaxID=2766967 RepID=A0ABS0N9A0_9NEIS|nr:tRNA (adenosine(37)-N6)-dimethylallyltransferase MiaA [Eikenella glucosivorans]MBH5328850.1 tRNA (adenosine(37)-N6)-dimethylallyltransferase MiaA [Eikenella glucosivorans]